MSTLQTQYKNYIQENPTSTLTYDEWLDKKLWEIYVSDDFQIGPDGAFERTDDEDLSDWDATLMDGLEDE
jgi:hypothetical protein